MAEKFKIDLQFDEAKLAAKIKNGCEWAIENVLQQAAKNMADKIPTDSGELFRSQRIENKGTEGFIEWGGATVPYAKKQYYGVELNHPKDGTPPHSEPQALWAQKDYDENKRQYQQIFNKSMER